MAPLIVHDPTFGLDVFTVVRETSDKHMAILRQQGAAEVTQQR